MAKDEDSKGCTKNNQTLRRLLQNEATEVVESVKGTSATAAPTGYQKSPKLKILTHKLKKK